MPTDTLPDWEEVLSAAALLQRILPEAVLVGGSASAVYAGHRMSVDAALQQLQIQLAAPLPFDLDQLKLSEYKHLGSRWHDWEAVKAVCADCATVIFDRIIGLDS